MTEVELAAAGREALEAGRWGEARFAFETSLAKAETPEALDGMGAALWWLGQTRSSVDYSERAYAGFRRAGDAVKAAVTAMSLCVTYASNYGNHVAAGGWLARAERMMGDADPNPLQGWFWLLRGYLETDPVKAQELQERAIEAARASGDLDMELCALCDLGLTLVTVGRVEEGLALVDEAMAGTLGGEHSRFDTVVFTCCDMLVACDLAGDLQRATQWCRVADQFIRKYGCPFLYARCRTLYGGVLVAKGQWAEAERELTAAVRMAGEADHPASHAEALARLADLRLRQGRLEEAEALLPELGGGRSAARTSARLRLAHGEPSVAVALLERSLEHHGEPNIHGENHRQAAAVLETLVAAHLVLGDLDGATAAVARLAALAGVEDQGQVAALAALASARVAGARQRPEDAVGHLERSLDLFSRLDLPHETALVRLELARTLAAGHPEMAVAEARNALGVFERLGAAGDADAAGALLRSLGAPGRTGPRNVGVLTRREQEVLRLVGLGLSNPEIAQRLFISRKTAAHHVSNLLAKLGLRNRAGAVAYAARAFVDDQRPS